MAATLPHSRLRSSSDPFVDPHPRQRPPPPPPKSKMPTSVPSRNSSQHDITEAVRDTVVLNPRSKISRTQTTVYVLFFPAVAHDLLILIVLVLPVPPPDHMEKDPSQKTPSTSLLAPQENPAARKVLNMRMSSIDSTSQVWDPVSTMAHSYRFIV